MEADQKTKAKSASRNESPDDIVDESEALDENTAQEDQSHNKSSPLHRVWAFVFGHKWLWILFIGLSIIPYGLNRIVKPKWPEAIRLIRPPIAQEKKISENLREEWLAPFFIPLPPNASNQVIRVDLSVIWDGLAAVRFKQKEIPIRDELYCYMLKRAMKGDDFNDKMSTLEDDMSAFIEDSLGTGELTIRIREIKYL